MQNIFQSINVKKVAQGLTHLLVLPLFFIALTVGTTLVVEPVYAQSKKEKEANLKYKDGIKTKKTQAVGATCARKLEKVQGFISPEEGEPNWPAAERELRNAQKSGCRPGFEQSEVNRYLGYVLYSQDKYPQAIKAYMAMINEPKADPVRKTSTRYTVAQLLYVQERYADAAKQLEAWRKESPVVDKNGVVLLARCYYNIKKKDQALKIVESVIREITAAGNVPKESWLNFQWVLYYEKSRYKDAVKVNNVLLTHYPKVKYWKQIAAMYAALENKEKETLSLAIMDIQDGFDKERQYVALAYQYMAMDVPYLGAKVLEKGMKLGKVEKTEKNLATLGQAYQRAQEYNKASPVLEQAAKKSSDGNAYSRLSSVYLNLNENEKALVAVRNALKKGKLNRPDIAWMNKGSAEAALHCYDAAAESFIKASKFEKSKAGAQGWYNYVSAEGERRKKLIANGAKLARCKKV